MCHRSAAGPQALSNLAIVTACAPRTQCLSLMPTWRRQVRNPAASCWKLAPDSVALACAGGRMPTARAAHEALVTALADQASWAARTTAAKELLAAMLASRRSTVDLAKQYDIR